MPDTQRPKFEEIDVERINVVDQQGTVRLVITNAERQPDPVMDGWTFERRPRRAGLLFFNDEGVECGGLIFHGATAPDGRYGAGALLALDQYKQDQAVCLRYEDDNGRRHYGLAVMDRPTAPLSSPEGGGNERVGLHNPRLFAGRTDSGDAAVHLCDRLGRPRLRLAVTLDGDAKIEFLDEQGRVTFSLGPDGVHGAAI